MLKLRPVPVFLRRHLGHQPLAGIDPKTGTLDMLMIGDDNGFFALIAEHPVVRAVVRNLQQFVGKTIGLSLFGPRVLLSELLVFGAPN